MELRDRKGIGRRLFLVDNYFSNFNNYISVTRMSRVNAAGDKIDICVAIASLRLSPDYYSSNY